MQYNQPNLNIEKQYEPSYCNFGCGKLKMLKKWV